MNVEKNKVARTSYTTEEVLEYVSAPGSDSQL